jgi:catechol 2,3-dioxygenase-like lactoylglutathione lyase family enzyme
MKFQGTLIAVADMERSKRFYHDVLGLNITADFGANVTLDGGIFLQTLDSWKAFIRTDRIVLQNNACELYFEEENMDAFSERLTGQDIVYVHLLFEHRWGQRVIRLYDPDRHVIEVGEAMPVVVRRFLSQGLTARETAVRMGVPLPYVQSCIKGNAQDIRQIKPKPLVADR